MKNDELVWEDGFKDSGISLQDTSAEAREKQARQLFAFAKENNISSLMQETDTSGRTSFGELNEGIYTDVDLPWEATDKVDVLKKYL